MTVRQGETATTIEVTQLTHRRGIRWKAKIAKKLGLRYLTWEQALSYTFNSEVLP